MTKKSYIGIASIQSDIQKIEKMRMVAKSIYENPEKIKDFERNPEVYARELNGFEPPAGFHLHVADAGNTLHPPEETGAFGADHRPDWSRTEFRVGYKTISLVVCI